jgi:hypothetical protein
MPIKEWTTQYPTNLDTTTQMPTLVNESSLGAEDGDFTRASHIHSLRDSVIQLETLMGTDSLESSSLRYRVIYPTWDYLDMNMPTGTTTTPKVLYQLDGTGDALTDRSGSGNTLTATGNVIYQPLHGKLGYQCDGAATYLSAVTDASYRITGAITVEVVAYSFVPASGTKYILACGNSGVLATSNYLYSIRLISPVTGITWYSENGVKTGDTVTFTGALPPGVIQHIAVTRDSAATDLNLYQDGVFIDNATGIAPVNGSIDILRLGRALSGTNYFQGIIFSVRISAEEFTAAQVLESYRRVRGIY